MNSSVTLTIANGIADVRLNRPDRLNAMNGEMVAALNEVILTLAKAIDVRVVVISGEGKAFCSGLDLSAMAEGGLGLDLTRRDFGSTNAVQHLAWGWRALPMPVIAAVHGVAFGAGLQIASGADIRIGSPQSRLAIRETTWGLVPDMAGIAIWRTLVRDDILRELVYSGREFSGLDAEHMGFLTSLSDQPLEAARRLAQTLCGRSPDAMAAAKRLLNIAADADVAQILSQERQEQVTLKGSANHREAVAAGLAKREPVFQNPT